MSQAVFLQHKITIEATGSGYFVLTQHLPGTGKNTILVHKDYIDIFVSALNNEIEESKA